MLPDSLKRCERKSVDECYHGFAALSLKIHAPTGGYLALLVVELSKSGEGRRDEWVGGWDGGAVCWLSQALLVHTRTDLLWKAMLVECNPTRQ